MPYPREYNQQLGEDLIEWKYRLIIGKVNRSVSLSWDDIADILGLGCRGEHLRKIAYGIAEYKEYMDRVTEEHRENWGEGEDVIDESEELLMSIEREKIRLKDVQRETRSLLREWARSENIKEEIMTAVRALNHTKPLVIPNCRPRRGGKREGALLLSDWHRGLLTNNNWNTFNEVEFNKRIERLVQKTIEYGKEHDISVLHVFALGDIINGLIHVTTRVMSDTDTVKQTMLVAETLAEILAKFAETFPEVKVYSARGNHDRVVANKKEAIASESFFDIVPWFLEARLAAVGNIEIVKNEYDDEIIVTNICGYNIFAVHGHRDHVKNVVQNLTMMLRIFPDYIFMGHIHHSVEDEIHSCEVVVNSSLSGTDDHAKELRKTSKAAQKFLIYEPGEGRLCTYNIKLA